MSMVLAEVEGCRYGQLGMNGLKVGDWCGGMGIKLDRGVARSVQGRFDWRVFETRRLYLP